MPNIFCPPTESRVKLTQELIRVARLPRRVWTPEESAEVADRMTALLRKPGSAHPPLRSAQAVALLELGTEGGMFGQLRVGSGKTLISFLAPTVTFAKRPLLLVPAALVDKTKRDQKLLSLHWDIPEFIKIMSYEILGRMQAAEALEAFRPDLIVLDECHRAANHSAAVTMRLVRHFRSHPVKCLAMSGTTTKRSLHDYAHILSWCLPAASLPIPTTYQDLEDWADATDERKGQTKRAHPGALETLCNEAEQEIWKSDPVAAARKAYKRRLLETRGVVMTEESPIDASLSIKSVSPKPGAALEASFQKLRSDWETPDGWPCKDGITQARHARELGIGFFYLWEPRPPKWWLEPRRKWHAFSRKVVRHSRKLDTEKQVREWVKTLERGQAVNDQGEDSVDLLEAWTAVAKQFEPNTVPVWIDSSVVEFAAEWACKEKGIVWVEHVCVGEKLEREYGIPYYAKKGLDGRGRFIDEHPLEEGGLVASIKSNSEGRNLQKWSKNLVLGWPPNGKQSEQLLGRTHRDGQEADEVYVDVVMTCLEHVEALDQATRDARYVHSVTGSPQKLLEAGVFTLGVDDLVSMSGPRWNK